MARVTHDREDLLRDGAAFSPRLEIAVPRESGTAIVFAGFRGEALSLFFGADPVYHFNSARKLRRAFIDDKLFKAERGRLVALTRQRTAAEVTLLSEPVSDSWLSQILADLEQRLQQLAGTLAAGEFVLRGEAPEDGGALKRLQAWLAAPDAIEVAVSARVQ